MVLLIQVEAFVVFFSLSCGPFVYLSLQTLQVMKVLFQKEWVWHLFGKD